MAPSRSSFAYAVVRIVPDIEREEFLNAGLILFCRPRQYLRARTAIDGEALSVIRPESDVAAIGEQLRFLEAVAAGTLEVGAVRLDEPVGALPLADHAAQHARSARPAACGHER